MRIRAIRLAAAALAGATLTSPVQAQEPPITLSGNVALTSDYVFRGTSQSDEHAALQGGLELALPTGGPELYAGFWGSSVDFTDATVEVDGYAGARGEIHGFGYDANVTYYWYPGSASNLNYDFVEIGGSLSYDAGFAIPTIGVQYSPDFFGDSDQAWYGYAGVEVPVPGLPLPLTLTAQVGHQWIRDNAAFGLPDYVDWQIGASVEVWGVALGVTYTDTDIAKSACGSDLCDGRVLFTVSKDF